MQQLAKLAGGGLQRLACASASARGSGQGPARSTWCQTASHHEPEKRERSKDQEEGHLQGRRGLPASACMPVVVGGLAGLAAYGSRSPYPPTLATRGSLLDGAWEPRLQTALAWAWQATFVTYKRNFPFFLSHNNTANFAKLSAQTPSRLKRSGAIECVIYSFWRGLHFLRCFRQNLLIFEGRYRPEVTWRSRTSSAMRSRAGSAGTATGASPCGTGGLRKLGAVVTL